MTDNARTETLLRRYRAGDQSAVDELLACHRAFIRMIVSSRIDRNVSARVDDSDVVQETLLVVARRLDDFLQCQPMTFRGWLRATAVECCIQVRRRHLSSVRDIRMEVAAEAQSSLSLQNHLLDELDTPSENLARFEIRKCIASAVNAMERLDREILLARNFQGMTNLETADALGISADAARKRYVRALQKLKSELSKLDALLNPPTENES